MSASVIRGRYVVTGGMDGSPFAVIEDGAVRQENGTIVEVGRAADLMRAHAADEVVGSPDDVVLPGLVNGHHHVGLTPFQLGSPDHPLELWFASRLAARDVDPYLDTLYSAFEMLESGITTVQHLHGWRGAPASRVRQVAERVLQAYEDVGMRVAYSYALRDQNRLVYEADEAFCRRLPPELGAQVAEYLRAQTIPLPDHLQPLRGAVGACRAEPPRARAGAARAGQPPLVLGRGAPRARRSRREVRRGHAHAPGRDGIPEGVRAPARRDHRARAPARARAARARGSRSATACGSASPTSSSPPGRARWCATTRARTCGSEAASRRSTRSPRAASAWRSGSTRPASTTTATCSRRCGWCSASTACRAWTTSCRRRPRCSRWPPPAAPPPPASPTASAPSSRGRAADLVLMPWKSLAYPYLDPATSVVDAVVHRGRASAVHTVLVGGEVVLKDGRPARVDKAAILEELAASLRAPAPAPRAAPPRAVPRGVPPREALLRRLARRGGPQTVLRAQLSGLGP